jgi:hypothetical protein
VSEDLESFLTRVLLRYFRKGTPQDVRSPVAEHADREFLILHWSISPEVQDLCTYLVRHPHELKAALQPKSVSGPAVRGRIKAAETVLLQTRTSDPTKFVFVEPFRTFDSGPNRVLGWTLIYAMTLARRFRSMLPEEATYAERTTEALQLVEDVRRLIPSVANSAIQPPSSNDVKAARASRLLLYRKAAATYERLRAIERLDLNAIGHLVKSSLVGPLEKWRQFELALALAMADAVAERTGSDVSLRHILPGASDVLIEIGRYAIRWQRVGPGFSPPALEKWEIREVEILAEYGMPAGYERPDVVMFDSITDDVVSIGEAKYFEDGDFRDRLREAVAQLTLYARGYETKQNADDILGRSIVAIWSAGDNPTPRPVTAKAPTVATFRDLQAGLGQWASRALP